MITLSWVTTITDRRTCHQFRYLRTYVRTKTSAAARKLKSIKWHPLSVSWAKRRRSFKKAGIRTRWQQRTASKALQARRISKRVLSKGTIMCRFQRKLSYRTRKGFWRLIMIRLNNTRTTAGSTQRWSTWKSSIQCRLSETCVLPTWRSTAYTHLIKCRIISHKRVWWTYLRLPVSSIALACRQESRTINTDEIPAYPWTPMTRNPRHLSQRISLMLKLVISRIQSLISMQGPSHHTPW